MAQEMTKVQQLGVLTALQKMVKAKADQLREQVYDDMADAYSLGDGGDKYVVLDGEQVGKVTLKVDKTGWEVTDPIEFEAFMVDNGQMEERWTLKPEYMVEAMARLKDYPWMLDCEMKPKDDFTKLFERCGDSVEVAGTNAIVPGVAPCKAKPKGIMVTGCKPQQVAPIVARIGGLDAMLLGDGSHE